MIFFKGATAYEFQLWRFGMRWVHLTGGGWDGAWPWERLSFQWFGKKYDE